MKKENYAVVVISTHWETQKPSVEVYMYDLLNIKTAERFKETLGKNYPNLDPNNIQVMSYYT